MQTHKIIKTSNTSFEAHGIGGYFWWDIFYEYGEWELWSIWGTFCKKFKKFYEVLEYIGGN